MSSRDNETAAAIARAATSFDGAVLGIGLALCAASTWAKYFATSHALRRIRLAPSAPISDLRSLLPSSSSDDDEAALIVVRGHVQPRSAVDAPPWASAKSFGSLVSQGSGERAVIVKQTQTCLYNEWRGIFGWSFDLHAIFAKSWKEQRTSSFRSVPFILVEGGRCHVLATPYTLFQAIFGNGYPVALLDEEKILPVGKEITAVGFCRTRDGALEVKPCQELPFFLSEMTKDEIEAELATNTAALLWSGILLGTLSIGILGYAIARNWSRWKEWRERRKRDRELRNQAASVPSGMEEELGEVPDGELCVICLMRRRRSAFIPCGHLVCCPSCALTVERDSFQSVLCVAKAFGLRSGFMILEEITRTNQCFQIRAEDSKLFECSFS
uniref:RING-type E3 ubiquitin transferase n=1 Tax=Ananas comosus var. bracteatus TaxID=296719 RepID=A0A6V7Q4B6_ANACO|nr:unnamed protein product [Ananas comosus var. bracteatus]